MGIHNINISFKVREEKNEDILFNENFGELLRFLGSL